MDSPLVRYTTTTDGVSIAYWTLGQGPALVILPTLLYSHLTKEWETPEWRRAYELLALERTVVRYDGRGTGVAQRDVPDYSSEAMLMDLDAAIGAATGLPVALVGNITTAPAAIEYAVRFPERVSHLILWTPLVDGACLAANSRFQAARKLAEVDWSVMCEAVAHDELAWEEQAVARRYAALMQSSLTRDAVLAQLPVLLETNVESLLPQIPCPTLVLHRSQSKALPAGEAERVAAAIPGAKLALFDGTCTAPFLGDWRPVMRTLAEFLGLDLMKVRTDGGARALRLLSMKSDALTPRERQVVQLVVRGLTNRQIADELFLAEKTVGNHIGRILVKLDLRSRTQLAAYAVEHGLTSRSA